MSFVSSPCSGGGPRCTNVCQCTIPWIVHLDEPIAVSGLEFRPLTCETDSVTVCSTSFDNSSVTLVPSSITSVTLAAANPSRGQLWIHNNSTSTLFIKIGAAASSLSFTTILGTQGLFILDPTYKGIVTGFWEQATGNAMVTEVVP
jgi:hypothetical protein